MSAIRPNLPQSLPQTGAAAPQVRNAQAAFCRAALGSVQATAPQAPAAQTRPAQTTREAPPASDSDRYPRLGQYLDIRV